MPIRLSLLGNTISLLLAPKAKLRASYNISSYHFNSTNILTNVVIKPKGSEISEAKPRDSNIPWVLLLLVNDP